jgi:hypothetical protein
MEVSPATVMGPVWIAATGQVCGVVIWVDLSFVVAGTEQACGQFVSTVQALTPGAP